MAADQSAETEEIALIEEDRWTCYLYGNPENCVSHVNQYESAFLTRQVRYSLSPFTVGDDTYPQRGMFVFHSADDTARPIPGPSTT